MEKTSGVNESGMFEIGRNVVPRCLANMTLDHFKVEVGALLDRMSPDELLRLDNKLWRVAIEQEFTKHPGLSIPEPLEVTNDETLFFQRGFTSQIRETLRLALQIKS